jgi:uncharacterized protein (DUF433 family)
VRTRGFCNLEFSTYREGNVGVPLIAGTRPLGGIVMRYIKSAMTGQKLLKDYIPQLTDLSARIAQEYEARTGGEQVAPNFGRGGQNNAAERAPRYLI